MKTFFLGSAPLLVLVAAGSAMAADIPVKAPMAPVVAPAYSWTGLYVGGNVGAAWGHSSWCTEANIPNCTSSFSPPLDVVNESATGVVGGGQFGYRWQFSNFVIGVEGMFDGMRLSNTSPSCLALAVPCGGGFFRGNPIRTTTFNDLYSVTGQMGYAWDRLLVYVKGGWAGTQLGFDALGNFGEANLASSGWANGWTAGGGIEYLVWKNISAGIDFSLGVEYDYYQFNTGNITNLANSNGFVVACAFCAINANVQTVTARANFKFN